VLSIKASAKLKRVLEVKMILMKLIVVLSVTCAFAKNLRNEGVDPKIVGGEDASEGSGKINYLK
jgi:hypothetical protein